MTNRLSPRDRAIIDTVARLKQVESGQLLRLFFHDNSPDSRRVRLSKVTKRLVKWGHLRRLPRAIGGWNAGSAGYIYTPALSKARNPQPHTLDLSELFTQLVEAERLGKLKLDKYTPEPWCHVEVGRLTLKPDAFVRIITDKGTLRLWIEMDEGVEYRAQLTGKLRSFVKAFDKWPDDTYPLVMFVVHDEQRQNFIQELTKSQPNLFTVQLFNQVVAWMTT